MFQALALGLPQGSQPAPDPGSAEGSGSAGARQALFNVDELWDLDGHGHEGVPIDNQTLLSM
jgi:hypothetical protein